jgi:hypothetical protein
MHDPEPIHVTLPADPSDPRALPPAPDGVIVHRVPALHPDDVTVVDGIPVTTVARTLIDLAEMMDADELRDCFAQARARGLLDMDDLGAARSRVEWRPSLAMLDEVIAEFASP